jgi:hypothetical protein
MEVIDDCFVLFGDILSLLLQHFVNRQKKKDGPWENKSTFVIFKFFEYNAV